VESWQWWALLNSLKDNEGLADLSGDDCKVTKRPYCLGNYSKFVRPGYRMVETTANPAPGIYLSAFRERHSGRYAIVVIAVNDAVALPVRMEGAVSRNATPWITSNLLDLSKQSVLPVVKNSFDAILPAQSVSTFVGKAR
jgi:glucuronoarabinoxylan endo-1,4-beta-xylanase